MKNVFGNSGLRLDCIKHLQWTIHVTPKLWTLCLSRHPTPSLLTGDYKGNLLHVYAHLVNHANNNKDFRLPVAEPKMGKVWDNLQTELLPLSVTVIGIFKFNGFGRSITYVFHTNDSTMFAQFSSVCCFIYLMPNDCCFF